MNVQLINLFAKNQQSKNGPLANNATILTQRKSSFRLIAKSSYPESLGYRPQNKITSSRINTTNHSQINISHFAGTNWIMRPPFGESISEIRFDTNHFYKLAVADLLHFSSKKMADLTLQNL